MGADSVKIGSIVIRCYEFARMLTFGRDALYYLPREPAKNGGVVLRVRLPFIGDDLDVIRFVGRGIDLHHGSLLPLLKRPNGRSAVSKPSTGPQADASMPTAIANARSSAATLSGGNVARKSVKADLGILISSSQ
jgi:hypothetical protein